MKKDASLQICEGARCGQRDGPAKGLKDRAAFPHEAGKHFFEKGDGPGCFAEMEKMGRKGGLGEQVEEIAEVREFRGQDGVVSFCRGGDRRGALRKTEGKGADGGKGPLKGDDEFVEQEIVCLFGKDGDPGGKIDCGGVRVYLLAEAQLQRMSGKAGGIGLQPGGDLGEADACFPPHRAEKGFFHPFQELSGLVQPPGFIGRQDGLGPIAKLGVVQAGKPLGDSMKKVITQGMAHRPDYGNLAEDLVQRRLGQPLQRLGYLFDFPVVENVRQDCLGKPGFEFAWVQDNHLRLKRGSWSFP